MIRGTLAETYLRNRCGDVPDDILDSDALRFSRNKCTYYYRGKLVSAPTMLGLFEDFRTGTPSGGVHRTPLLSDGSGVDGRIGKRMLGTTLNAAIMLTAHEDVGPRG